MEARAEATGHGLARGTKRCLGHGVVLGHEDELDGIARVCCNLVGIVLERGPADYDLEVSGGGGGGKGSEGSGGESETHFDLSLGVLEAG